MLYTCPNNLLLITYCSLILTKQTDRNAWKKGLENKEMDFKNGWLLLQCTADRQTTKLHFYEAAHCCVQPKNSIQKEMVVKTNILVYELDSSNWQWNIVYFGYEFKINIRPQEDLLSRNGLGLAMRMFLLWRCYHGICHRQMVWLYWPG